MGVKSNAFAAKVLDYEFGLGADGPAYTDFYIALFKGGSEVTGTGYARQQTDPTTDYSRTGQIVSNDVDIDFGTAGSDWALAGDEIDEIRIYDAVSGGNLIMSKTLAAPQIVASGAPVIIYTGALQFTEI